MDMFYHYFFFSIPDENLSSRCLATNHNCFILQDVFTVSVGNLPPGCVALIKITYVSELQVEGELINFSIPGSVAPWKQEANNTQVR